MKKKAIILLVLIGVIITLIPGCSDQGSGSPDLSGTFVCETMLFDIQSLSFNTSGKVDLSMDWEYTGTYKKSGNKYTITITGGKSSVSGLLAKEKNKAYKITVEKIDNDTLTVYIKAGSGYIYYGKPSAVFKRK